MEELPGAIVPMHEDAAELLALVELELAPGDELTTAGAPARSRLPGGLRLRLRRLLTGSGELPAHVVELRTDASELVLARVVGREDEQRGRDRLSQRAVPFTRSGERLVLRLGETDVDGPVAGGSSRACLRRVRATGSRPRTWPRSFAGKRESPSRSSTRMSQARPWCLARTRFAAIHARIVVGATPTSRAAAAAGISAVSRSMTMRGAPDSGSASVSISPAAAAFLSFDAGRPRSCAASSKLSRTRRGVDTFLSESQQKPWFSLSHARTRA